MNLNNNITRAKSQNILWSQCEFYDVIDILEQTNIQVSYWENEENWASLIVDNQLVGYMWSKSPIIFIIQDFFNVVYQSLQSKNYVSIIKVELLTTRNLKLDKPLLDKVFNVQLINEEFSVDDLWFYTNT